MVLNVTELHLTQSAFVLTFSYRNHYELEGQCD